MKRCKVVFPLLGTMDPEKLLEALGFVKHPLCYQWDEYTWRGGLDCKAYSFGYNIAIYCDKDSYEQYQKRILPGGDLAHLCGETEKHLSLSFEENDNQTNGRIRYIGSPDPETLLNKLGFTRRSSKGNTWDHISGMYAWIEDNGFCVKCTEDRYINILERCAPDGDLAGMGYVAKRPDRSKEEAEIAEAYSYVGYDFKYGVLIERD